MSNRAITWAWGVHGLSPLQRVVLLRLADWADHCGVVNTSAESVARQSGLEPGEVQLAVKSLRIEQILRGDFGHPNGTLFLQVDDR